MASDRLPSDTPNESDSNLIEMLRLREGEYLRRAAVLLFHPDPVRFFAGAFVKIGYFRTETDLAYQDVIEGNLFTQVDRTVDLLRTKYSKAEVSYDGIYRRETPPAPGEALREAVLNAVAHRDYGSPSPIQIQVYDDRIALWNPGALPPDWTLDKLMGAHASAPYNPGIANAFFRAGMIEAWGRGIGAIVGACQAAGTARPRWEVEPGGLRLEFVFTEPEAGPPSRNAVQETVRGRRDTPRETGDPAYETTRGERRQPESQPESRPESQSESLGTSRPESLGARVIRKLADGPMSKADLSSSLGQKKISGQLNKVIRLLVADGSIEYTIPQKPRSRLQKYRLTDKGRVAAEGLPTRNAGA